MTREDQGMRVKVRKQGGGWVNGTAVGRMGSQLLVQYHITDGSPRERWFPKARYEFQRAEDQANISELPRYKRVTCKAERLPVPLTRVQIDEKFGKAGAGVACPRCGEARSFDTGEDGGMFDKATGEKVMEETWGRLPEGYTSWDQLEACYSLLRSHSSVVKVS
jgi:hypothetical protein